MGVKNNKKQAIKKAAEKVGAADKLSQVKSAKGKGHTSKADNQSGADAMNVAVAEDVKQQEKDAAEAAAAEAGNPEVAASDTPDALENYGAADGPDDVGDEAEKGVDEAAQKKVDFDAAVEVRAQEIADERAANKAAVPRSAAAAPLDVNDHNNICLRMTVAIDGIKKVVPHLDADHAGLGVLFGMLAEIGKVTAKRGKALPNLDEPSKRPSFGGIKFGEHITPKACGIYRRELIGHCTNLVECADHLPKKWLGAWVGYLNTLKKVLEKADA